MTETTPAPAHNSRHNLILWLITVPGFLLAALCLKWYADTDEIALLLLGLVTLGMAYDFLSHILGSLFADSNRFLQIYSRINFAALCFGIPFTAFAGSFIMDQVVPGGISSWLVEHYLPILHGSVLFGLLFLFARYKRIEVAGAVEYTLDKSHTYTRIIFLVRRILLGASLFIGLAVAADAWGTPWLPWALAFVGVFIASVPLHILHKQIPSMLSELITQLLAIYASWQVFVA